ncbi:MAG: sulfur carrier protein ThiS adenylyltransferase ThiF, partial [Lentisphaeria bacterium]|nr:sulfur carrier protein ThiS adenylyltransferase ThiF [Lentisphaeria bacterium]
MIVLLHEREHDIVAGTTLFELRDRAKPGADVVVLNGAIVTEDTVLQADDSVHYIRRGEAPSA